MTATDTAHFGGQRITIHGEGSAAAASAHIVVVACAALALKVAADTQCDKSWVVLIDINDRIVRKFPAHQR